MGGHDPCRRRTWRGRCRRGTARRRRSSRPTAVGPNGSVIRRVRERPAVAGQARRAAAAPLGERQARVGDASAAASAGRLGATATAAVPDGASGIGARDRVDRRAIGPRRLAASRSRPMPTAHRSSDEAEARSGRTTSSASRTVTSDGARRYVSTRRTRSRHRRCVSPAGRGRKRSLAEMVASSDGYAYDSPHEPPHLLGRVQEEALAALPGGTGPGALTARPTRRTGASRERRLQGPRHHDGDRGFFVP